ncbi:hypothetical protein F4802DRAFT_9828 [Xylaria palmicola]|nr:hypothetical protein F4802DRAFT_9828 [Xylaria palmicola]
MCFTSADRSDDPPPRPAQQMPQGRQSASMPPPPPPPPPSSKQQRLQSQAQATADYAPPSGPPPPHREPADDYEYAPPSGPPPPPSHRPADDYAPPSGPPPPSHQAADGYAPPSGPPPSHRATDDYAPPSGPPPPHRAADEYAPPSGPPPSHDYAPPAGPPPSNNNPFYEDVTPPAGPPPSHSYAAQGSSDFAPPPGPPPSHDYAPPSGPPPSGEKETKKHDWETAVPDTSLLPPPPSFFSGFERSPANNATEEEAEAGEQWCREFPLFHSLQLDPAALSAMESGNINIIAPPSYRGTLARQAVGVWHGQSHAKAADTCLATYPPLYNASTHSPLATGRRKLIYYEVRILADARRGDGDEVTLALGFAAPPYPPFRLPGWHRASLGVHGDDGHRYVNDRWGGKAFTQPFRAGETLGLGMELAPGSPGGGGGGIAVDVFLTRDGYEHGRWNLHEETDQEQDLPVTGLEGFHDLCAAVGVFDRVGFEVVFVPERWLWKGWRAHQG